MRREKIETIRWAIRGALALLLFIAAFVINGNILTIRLQDLDNLLGSASLRDRVSTTEILGRYRLILERLEGGSESLEAFETEIQLATLSTNILEIDQYDEKVDPIRHRSFERALLVLLRRAVGKPPVTVTEQQEAHVKFQNAYMLERQRHWHEAVEAYQELLKTEDLDERTIATLRIHLGFCLSMTGDYSAARKEYERILDTNGGTEFAEAAVTLIDSIDAIEAIVASRTRNTTTIGVDDPLLVALNSESGQERDEHNQISAARQAYLEARYSDTISAVDSILDSPRNDPPSLNIEISARYYRGRALEENGNYQAALSEYRIIAGLIQAERRSNPSEDGLTTTYLDEWNTRTQRRQAIIQTFYLKDDRDQTTNHAMDAPFATPDQPKDPYLAIIQRYVASVPDESTGSEDTAVGVDESPRSVPTPSDSPRESTIVTSVPNTPDRSAEKTRDFPLSKNTPSAQAPREITPESERRPRSYSSNESARRITVASRETNESTDIEGELNFAFERELNRRNEAEEEDRLAPEGATPSNDAPHREIDRMVDRSAIEAPQKTVDSPTGGETDAIRPSFQPTDRSIEGRNGSNRRSPTGRGIPSEPTDQGSLRTEQTASLLDGAPYNRSVEATTTPQPPQDRTAEEGAIGDGGDSGEGTDRENTRRYIGNIIRVEENGTILVLMETDTRLGENEELVLYRETPDGGRIVLGTARPIGRVPPRLIAQIRTSTPHHYVRQGDWAYVLRQ